MEPVRRLLVVISCVIVVFPTVVSAQIVSPAPGQELPQVFYDATSKNPRAFRFEHAWLDKTRRAKALREAYLSQPEPERLTWSSLPAATRSELAVSGTLQVPVIMIKFANTGSDPYPTTQLQNRLFTPPPAASLTALYDEMSYGLMTMTGTVYGWVTAAQNDTYYEGPAGACGLNCTLSKTGNLIKEALDATDPTMDFGIYDNDGPDGVPNSGDDDGFVDFIAIVHPETGGECLGQQCRNIWSHRWVVGGWPAFGRNCNDPLSFGSPYTTNDASANGGFIRIWDYTIQPAIGSSNGCGTGMVEIGVFCHEFGHAFGLPDLYDADNSSSGIGHHGLMGAGNWRTPQNPTHMSAWSKTELGWVAPVEVGPTLQPYNIQSVEVNPDVYQINIYEEKFNRKTWQPLSGAASLHCGLPTFQAGKRNWGGGSGYGNGWDESIRCDFTYDGTGPVTLQFDASWDCEPSYDYGYLKIDVGGAEHTLASFDNIGSATGQVIDLTPYLSGSGVTGYTLIAQFVTDGSYSDEDGLYDSQSSGPFKLDNVSVTGGGENYFSDFEQYEDGWYYDFGTNPCKEFFLVENRNTAGAQFDQNLHGEGLFIWHVENNVAHSALGNSGTVTDLLPAGVRLEEADGLEELINTNTNRGDSGDMFPGATSNRTFDNTTNPNSKSYNDFITNVIVQNISDPAPTMTANMRGGRLPIDVTAVTPTSGNNDGTVAITDIDGSRFAKGATFLIRASAGSVYSVASAGVERLASSVEWVGRTKLAGELDLTGLAGGVYDLVVLNVDGQEAVLAGGFTVVDVVPVFIQSFTASRDGITPRLSWAIWSDEDIQGFRILRREVGQAAEIDVYPYGLIDAAERSFTDETALASLAYEYVLVVVLDDGSELRSNFAAAGPARLALELHQNHPNPFNPTTTIGFTMPTTDHARLDIYDVQGRHVARLVDEIRSAGANDVMWNGRDDAGIPVSSGVYVYRLVVGKMLLTKKLLLLK